MNLLLSTFWLFRTVKYVLFWLYLWQLKEYHIGRFFDHFNTEKGKKNITNPLLWIKVLLFAILIIRADFLSVCVSILFFIYLLETLVFIKQVYQKSFKKPVKTAKTLLLMAISFLIIGTALYFISTLHSDWTQFLWLLIFDIFLPLIISGIVLLVQPFFVIARNNILKKAARKLGEHKNLKVIGITGSYGKTSTKEFLATILKTKYRVLHTKEHQNSEMGIAKCILESLSPEHEIFVVEMGSYKKGGIKLLCDMVKPQIGIVTGVNEQHLSLFGSLENLLSAEGGRELADALPQNGLLALNGDNKYCLELYKKFGGNKKTYSLNRAKLSSDIWAEEISVTENSVSFLAITKNREACHFDINVLGRQNVQNILGAILVAKEIGMGLDEISIGCQKINPSQSGMILVKGKHDLDIIDSSYSANPDGVLADLDYLNIFPGKKIIVMPCLIELGNKSGQIHEKLGQKIGKICDVAIITTKENFENIKKGALYAGLQEKNIVFCENPNDIYSIITLQVSLGDAVLLEGRVPKKLIELLTK